MNFLAGWALVGAMKRCTGTELAMAIAATAAFLFVFALTVVPRPPWGSVTVDLASASKR